MTQTNALQLLERPAAPLATVLAQTDRLGFPTSVLGQSRGPLVAQRVGAWWMQPLTDPSTLPTRARQRLDALLASGVTPRGVVVFHELTATPVRSPSVWERHSSRLTHWAQQELPVVAERVAQTIAYHAPIVGKVTLDVSLAITRGLAMVIWGTAGVIAEAVINDPCLVIVTEDGYWVEIDRWFS